MIRQLRQVLRPVRIHLVGPERVLPALLPRDRGKLLGDHLHLLVRDLGSVPDPVRVTVPVPGEHIQDAGTDSGADNGGN